MDLDDALRRYRQGLFTDRDITECTGLSVRSWRELIKIGAVRTTTVGRGPGRVRLCDTATFKRTAIIAAIKGAGFSLPVAGRIAYFLPFEELLFGVWDPFTVLFLHNADDDPATDLPPRLEVPRADWFDPRKPAEADPANDWFIEIYDGRFIGGNYKVPGQRDELFLYADLRNEGSNFVSWLPFHEKRPVFDIGGKSFVDAVATKWDRRAVWADRLDPAFLSYRYENHQAEDDPLRLAAEAAARSPLFRSTINVTLAVRKALRRYLGIEPVAAGCDRHGEDQ